jgi:hypothetical protein
VRARSGEGGESSRACFLASSSEIDSGSGAWDRPQTPLRSQAVKNGFDEVASVPVATGYDVVVGHIRRDQDPIA